MHEPIDVVAVGHAIVDVLAPSPEEAITRLALERGAMQLVDEDEAARIYDALGPATEASGGSAANTAACLASFGSSAAFVGKVAQDELGHVFTHDIRSSGVAFDVAPAESEHPTGRCLIFVTPDGQRTMCTNLGIGALLEPQDLDEALISSAKVLYLEGYLYGKLPSDPAVERAIDIARDAGREVSLSLSDPYWVELHGRQLASLLDKVDILFANEEEAVGVTGIDGAEGAALELAKRCGTVAVTLGPSGSLVASNGSIVRVPAVPVHRVVDTTGAGDSYAAGFLHGYNRGSSPERCAELGSLAAAELISHMGARPLESLAKLAEAAGY